MVFRMTDEKNLSDDADIVSGMETRGCPACDHILARVLEFFAQWIHDLSENEDRQKENAQAHGLCAFHTWQLAAMGSPLGISRGYSKLMRQIADELQKGSGTQTKAAVVIGALVSDAGNCRICHFMRKETSDYLSKIATFLTFEENRRLYNASGGLCLRHLHDLALEITDPEMIRYLMYQAAKHFAAIADNMDRYSAKRAASQKHLLTRSEEHAYLRGLIHVAGGKHICNEHHVSIAAAGLSEGEKYHGGNE